MSFWNDLIRFFKRILGLEKLKKEPKSEPETKTQPQQDPVPIPKPKHKGIAAYWIKSSTTKILEQDPNHYKEQGITDLMVSISRISSRGVSNYYKDFLPKVINHFEGTGINIHAWMTVFKDYNGQWVTPNTEEGKKWASEIINLTKDISTIPGLKGIQFDYIRYPEEAKGETQSITNFCKTARETIPNLILSAAVMPETKTNAFDYGQDYKSMGHYLDYLCPMIYKGNYPKADRNWIISTTKWINEQAPDKIVAGLQSYKSDIDLTPLPVEEITADIKATIDAGAIGFIIYREGLSNYVGGAILVSE